MRVLITGCNGYIGPVMAQTLLAEGHAVTGTDTNYFDNCYLAGDIPAYPRIDADIRDIAASALAGFDAIVHLAALSNDPLGDLKADWTFDINVAATERLARLAMDVGGTLCVDVAAGSIYGAAGGDERLGESAPLAPITPYAVSKVRCEEALSKLAGDRFSPVYMRNATAYGISPRLRTDLVLNNLVAWAATTGRVNILSDGTAWRPIVNIVDISRAVAAVLAAPRETVHDQAFNIGRDAENFRVRDIAEIVARAVPGSEIAFGGEKTADARSYRVSFAKYVSAFPDRPLTCTALAGAEELYRAFTAVGLTLEQFQSRRFVRLKQLRHLIDENAVDGNLRWRSAHKAAKPPA